MTTQWPYPGARWWKFDFHTHTPASTDTHWHKLVGQVEELTPEQWLTKYMAAEIDCVAITDHNSGAWIDKLKAAYAGMQKTPPAGFRELFLFPGVEISVNGGFHLLAIFDITKTTSDIDKLLGKVDYSGTNGNSDGVTRRSPGDVVQAVLDAGGIPIPAHADERKGLLRLKEGSTNKAELDPLTLVQVLEKPGILAMEVINEGSSMPTCYTQRGLKWSQVLGSDCHSFQGNAIPGSRYTWIKMAKPSLEGLSLALLDGQGISIRRSDEGDFSPFDKPEHFIESIEIADARFMGRGQPAVFQFNPYFNALVGGRGTGKSTVVHALRLAYRREGELDSQSEAGQTFARFNRVARNRTDQGGLQVDTHLTLTLQRDGISHRLHWRQDGQGVVVEEQDPESKSWQPSSTQMISNQRFPVRLFSQGQIAALAGDSQQSLLKVIDEAAGTAQAQDSLSEAKRSFFATRAKVREMSGKLQGREALDVSLQDVQRKLQRFEAAHHAEILKTYQRTSRQSREIDRQFETAAEITNRLRALAGDLLVEDLPEGLFDPARDAQALQAIQHLAEAIDQARTAVEEAARMLVTTGTSLKGELQQSAWREQIDHARSAYETLKADLQTQGVSDPSEYGRLVQERQRLEGEAKKLDALQKQREELIEQTKSQWEQIAQVRRAISEVRQDFLQYTLEENPFVRITLLPYGEDEQAMDRSLRDVLGTSDKFKDDIYVEAQGDSPAKGMIADMMASVAIMKGAEQSDSALLEDRLKDLRKRLVKACSGKGDFGGWFNKYLAAETEKRAEFVDHLYCWFPEDGLKVEYSRKGDGKDFQSIGQASAGQRAAAMLAFLLAHGDEPLVLDQPEDDLDNHLIYDLVVQQIRANKQRRQLIVVTHNPNIVVNGDAEMIHALDFNNQCFIKQSGSLQDHVMRNEVCKVMEGGEIAFERRYQRLGKKA